MFRTTRQSALIFAIAIFSSLAAMQLVSSFHDERLYNCLDAPGAKFKLTPDRGTAAILVGNISTAPFARIHGTPAYKEFMLRQNPSFVTSNRPGDLQRPVSQLQGCNESLWTQEKITEDIDKAAVEPLLRDLKAATEAFLGNLVCFVKVVLPGHENNQGYHANIIAGALRQIGLVEI